MTGGLAHEIKNPLSTIGLNAQLLSESIADSSLPTDQRDRLLRRMESLSREVERLRGILTDFLEFAGRMKLDPQPRDLVRIVNELSDFFHPQCDQAGITLRTQLPPLQVMVRVDEGLLKQAILNLLINAVQAVQAMQTGRDAKSQSEAALRSNVIPGGGELILRVEFNDCEATLHVIDTGPGVPAEKLTDIFRPYFTTRSGGTGLGLPTARRIVQEHGGRLTVHSEPGRGSDFAIHLALEANKPQNTDTPKINNR